MVPLDTLEGFRIRPGFFDINGATALSDGVCFTIHSQGATSCELLLYEPYAKEPFAILKYPDNYRIGNVFSMIVFDLDVEDFQYAFRLDGPYDKKKGLLFDKHKPLLDPYAKAVVGQSEWGQKPDAFLGYRGRVVKNNFDWGITKPSIIPMEDLIIYEMHVRGFTKDASSGVAHPGTFHGIMEKIPYLKELGINAVELMPIFEFDEMRDHRVIDGRELLDYWGYNTVSFFAPNTSYASDREYNHVGTELKQLIKTLKENGIEVILDVVFNHTAEGNEDGPFFSFKGIDNNVYYMLTPDGNYYNFSGCGNTVNCNHPVVQQMIVECLRYWVTTYRVDGFRFDLASILGRNEDGTPMDKPPLLQTLAFDPILGDVKLIAEAWDAGGLYQVGNFPSWKRWSEWNGKYRDDLRDFLKGGYWKAPEAALRISGSSDLYNPFERGTNASINFITCHDGFSLYDLYSYNHKHNEANGWNNTDGSDDNRSWNCGTEGDTKDPLILKLRYRMIKNAFAVLICSRGTPMFLSGDEFCDTRFGNNNPYCQDNLTSWLDWKLLDTHRDIFEFCKYMIHFRRNHPAIRKSIAQSHCGFPPISQHGATPWDDNFTQDSKIVCTMFAGHDEKQDLEDIVYLAVNPYWESILIHLPKLPEPLQWHLAVDTSLSDTGGCTFEKEQMSHVGNDYLIGARTVVVLTAH
jgi:glycogen operon protein